LSIDWVSLLLVVKGKEVRSDCMNVRPLFFCLFFVGV
jgi:hypothetical protein